MASISCCTPNFDINPLLSGLHKGLVGTKDAAVAFGKNAIYVLNKATNSVEARNTSHVLTESIIKIAEVAGASIPALDILGPIISTVDGVFNGWDIAEIGKYFFHKEVKGTVPPRIVKEADGSFVVKNKNYEGTKADYHIEAGKSWKVAAKVGFFVKAIGSFVTLLNVTGLIDLAAYSAELSKLAHVGGVISKIVSPMFFTTLAAAGGIVAYGALTIDSVIYLSKAINGDPDKSVTKGLLELGSRVAFLALSIIVVAQVTNPYVIIPVMVVGGALGIAAIVYTAYREIDKAKKQKADLEDFLNQGDGGGGGGGAAEVAAAQEQVHVEAVQIQDEDIIVVGPAQQEGVVVLEPDQADVEVIELQEVGGTNG